jgi:hypothetical protein
MTVLGPDLQAEVRDAAFEAAYEFGLSAANCTLTVRDFEQAFRAGFLHAASIRIRASGAQPTIARLAIESGLTRSGVEQSLAADADFDRAKERKSFDESGIFAGLSLLVSLWNSDPRFTQMYGVPRDLLIRRAAFGESATLEDAAAIALPQVPLERVLQELSDRGLISIDRLAATAKLVADVIPIQDFEARAAVRFGRLSAGLMRTLRTNFEHRLDSSKTRRMWEKSFWTDRPIAKAHTREFMALADQSIRTWMQKVESIQRMYTARNQDEARLYCIAAFSIEKHGDDDEFAAPENPLLLTILTSAPISDAAAADFVQEVNDSATTWLSALDAEQHNLLAAVGERGSSIEICAFMFDVAGGKSDPESRAVDLVHARYTDAVRIADRG